jgi:hypothetical protein
MRKARFRRKRAPMLPEHRLSGGRNGFDAGRARALKILDAQPYVRLLPGPLELLLHHSGRLSLALGAETLDQAK